MERASTSWLLPAKIYNMNYKTILGKTVQLTSERKLHIEERHPDVIIHLPKVKRVLISPDEIRIDTQDQQVLLFYKYFSTIDTGKYLVVIVKINERNFILTYYSTYRLKSGVKYEYQKTT